jgi:hypothetical protein
MEISYVGITSAHGTVVVLDDEALLTVRHALAQRSELLARASNEGPPSVRAVAMAEADDVHQLIADLESVQDTAHYQRLNATVRARAKAARHDA